VGARIWKFEPLLGRRVFGGKHSPAGKAIESRIIQIRDVRSRTENRGADERDQGRRVMQLWREKERERKSRDRRKFFGVGWTWSFLRVELRRLRYFEALAWTKPFRD
jgi:hypothetical protein